MLAWISSFVVDLSPVWLSAGFLTLLGSLLVNAVGVFLVWRLPSAPQQRIRYAKALSDGLAYLSGVLERLAPLTETKLDDRLAIAARVSADELAYLARGWADQLPGPIPVDLAEGLSVLRSATQHAETALGQALRAPKPLVHSALDGAQDKE